MGEKLTAALLPVTASSNKGKKKQSWMPPLMSVDDALKWAFIVACYVAVTLAISTSLVLADIHIPSSQQGQPAAAGDQAGVSSVPLLRAPELTPAQDVEVEFFGLGFLWFTVPQAAAAAVGLLLPCRHARTRWSLAFLAIVCATIAHYMEARTVSVFIAAKPGDILYGILAGGGAAGFLLGDLFGLLSLLIGAARQ